MGTHEVAPIAKETEKDIPSYNVEEILISSSLVSSCGPGNMNVSETATSDTPLEDDISSFRAKSLTLPGNVSVGGPNNKTHLGNSSDESSNHVNGSTCGKWFYDSLFVECISPCYTINILSHESLFSCMY